MYWIRDEEFIRGKVPMTKYDIRVITLAMLNISPDDHFLDVGSGTGSIAIQAAALGAKVTAIERKEEAVELIRQNAEKFNVELDCIQGDAPDGLRSVKGYNKCFVGGSRGLLKNILYEIHANMPSGGRLAGNFIKIDNMVNFRDSLKNLHYQDIECRLIQASKEDRLGMLKAENPIWIVGGTKQ